MIQSILRRWAGELQRRERLGAQPKKTWLISLSVVVRRSIAIEKGERPVNADEIRKIASFLGRKIHELVGTLSLRLPESLHRQARDLAKQEGISINQRVTTALAEKMLALLTDEYLQARAARGDRKKLDRALGKVKNRRPTDEDQV